MAGAFDNTAGGQVISGRNNAVEVFGVDGAGAVTGASFAGDGSGLTSVDAATLDALDSAQLLRSDASDSLTAGTLTLDPGTTLDVDGALDASGATALSLPTTGITGGGSGSGLDAEPDGRAGLW